MFNNNEHDQGIELEVMIDDLLGLLGDKNLRRKTSVIFSNSILKKKPSLSRQMLLVELHSKTEKAVFSYLTEKKLDEALLGKLISILNFGAYKYNQASFFDVLGPALAAAGGAALALIYRFTAPDNIIFLLLAALLVIVSSFKAISVFRQTRLIELSEDKKMLVMFLKEFKERLVHPTNEISTRKCIG